MCLCSLPGVCAVPCLTGIGCGNCIPGAAAFGAVVQLWLLDFHPSSLCKKKFYTWKTAWIPLAPSPFYTGYDTFFHTSIPGFWLVPFLPCVFYFHPPPPISISALLLTDWFISGPQALTCLSRSASVQPGASEQIQKLPGIPLLRVCPLAFRRTLKIIKQSLFARALCGSRWISALMNNHLCSNPNQQNFSLYWWGMRHLAG